MDKLVSKLRQLPKRAVGFTAIITAAIAVPAVLFAYGPDRPTYTVAQPANHVTFNSITDNPGVGDERDFVGIREKGTTGVWKNNMTVERNKEYVVRAYVHNNASENLNLVAQNTRAMFNLPTTTGRSIEVQGSISADNASPRSVWDEATFNGTEDFNLAYVPGTLKYSNNVFGSAGVDLSESIFTSAGAQLGYDKLDGKIPGCFKYDGYVYFTVKPQFAPTNSFDTQKQVRKVGETTWQENVNVNPGDEVEYQLTYKNTGGTRQNNVVMRDTLPQGMSYVAGSTYLKNTVYTTPTKVSDNLTTSTGINIGDYQPNSVAYVKFTAKVGSNEQLPTCGINKLTNKVRTTVDGGYKEDTADVTVPKECQPEAEYKCTALAVSKLSDNKFKFETGYSVTGGTFKSVSYTIRNAAGQTVATVAGTPNVAEYTQATPGSYTVQATVTFTVNGQDVTATGEACKKAFEVKEKDIIVCELETKKIVTIKESEFDASKYSKNLDDCKEKPTQIIVCDLTTKEIVTINEDEFDSNKYSKNLEDCKTPEEYCPIPGKEHLPADSAECKEDEKCPIPGKEHLPAYSAECETPVTPVTPTTPTELPQTGSTDGVLTIAGLATLALVLGYAVTARRTLG